VKVTRREYATEDDSRFACSCILGELGRKSGSTELAASSGAGNTDSHIYQEPLGRESVLLLDHVQFDGYNVILGGT
jgi:hypothetical protein